jgi:hypothetical protein
MLGNLGRFWAGVSAFNVKVRILLYPRADVLATGISWTDRPALGGHCEGAAARDVRAPPRVCAEADLCYESYINLAPPF